MTDTSTFPTFPPLPDDPGEFLTSFGGDIASMGLGASGDLVVHVKVNPEDKYLALPLSDVRSRQFIIAVYAPHGRRPVLTPDRQAAVTDAYTRPAVRKQAREWKRARLAYFDGHPDE